MNFNILIVIGLKKLFKIVPMEDSLFVKFEKGYNCEADQMDFVM